VRKSFLPNGISSDELADDNDGVVAKLGKEANGVATSEVDAHGNELRLLEERMKRPECRHYFSNALLPSNDVLAEEGGHQNRGQKAQTFVLESHIVHDNLRYPIAHGSNRDVPQVSGVASAGERNLLL
jgi:hypothetical protein